MTLPRRLLNWKISLFLACLLALSAIIVACGEEETPAPTAAPAPPPATIDMSAITAMTSGMSAEIQQALAAEIAKIQPPLSEDEIRGLVEGAISENVGEGVKSSDIQKMVDSAVMAVAGEGVNQEEVASAIADALAAAAAGQQEPLSQADIERIVKAAVATPVPTAMPATPAPTAVPTPTPAMTMAPKVPVAARLIVVVPPPTDQFTIPYAASQTTEKIMPIYDHLVGRHYQNNEEQPEMAADWNVADDGKTWTFNLRDDVPFYKNAEPMDIIFDADDVILVFELLTQHEGITTKTRSPGNWFNRIDSPDKWVIEDPHTLRLDLPNINLDIAFLLSEEWESGIISRKHWDAVGGEDGYIADPVGTGPWSFISLETNVGFLHERVEDHWRQTPLFHELEGRFIKEAATRLALLINQEVHVGTVPRDLYSQAAIAGLVVSRSTLPGRHPHLRLAYYRPENYCAGNPPMPIVVGGRDCGPNPAHDPNDPLRDVNVRLALNHAIDRDAINQAFFAGDTFPLVDYFPPWREDFKDEWAPFPNSEGKTGAEGGWPYDYNVEKAREYLAKSNFPDGFTTTLAYSPTSSFSEQGDISVQLKQYWEEIGITANLKPLETSLTRWLGSAPEPNIMIIASPSLDPICTAVTFWWRENGRGYREHQEISDFKAACRMTTDIDERNKLAQDFAEWWISNAISVPLVWVFDAAIYNPNVVSEYKVNLLHMGPIRYHEFTVPVYQ